MDGRQEPFPWLGLRRCCWSLRPAWYRRSCPPSHQTKVRRLCLFHKHLRYTHCVLLAFYLQTPWRYVAALMESMIPTTLFPFIQRTIMTTLKDSLRLFLYAISVHSHWFLDIYPIRSPFFVYCMMVDDCLKASKLSKMPM
jgi:hypothetical protein